MFAHDICYYLQATGVEEFRGGGFQQQADQCKECNERCQGETGLQRSCH